MSREWEVVEEVCYLEKRGEVASRGSDRKIMVGKVGEEKEMRGGEISQIRGEIEELRVGK